MKNELCPGCGHPHKSDEPCRLDLVEEIARLVAEGYAAAREVANV